MKKAKSGHTLKSLSLTLARWDSEKKSVLQRLQKMGVMADEKDILKRTLMIQKVNPLHRKIVQKLDDRIADVELYKELFQLGRSCPLFDWNGRDGNGNTLYSYLLMRMQKKSIYEARSAFWHPEFIKRYANRFVKTHEEKWFSEEATGRAAHIAYVGNLDPKDARYAAKVEASMRAYIPKSAEAIYGKERTKK